MKKLKLQDGEIVGFVNKELDDYEKSYGLTYGDPEYIVRFERIGEWVNAYIGDHNEIPDIEMDYSYYLETGGPEIETDEGQIKVVVPRW